MWRFLAFYSIIFFYKTQRAKTHILWRSIPPTRGSNESIMHPIHRIPLRDAFGINENYDPLAVLPDI